MNCRATLDWVKGELGKRFKMKDLGPASYILGLEITRNRQMRTLHLSQRKHALDVLTKFSMLDSKPVSTPLDPGCVLTKDQSRFSRDKVVCWDVRGADHRVEVLREAGQRAELFREAGQRAEFLKFAQASSRGMLWRRRGACYRCSSAVHSIAVVDNALTSRGQ